MNSLSSVFSLQSKHSTKVTKKPWVPGGFCLGFTVYYNEIPWKEKAKETTLNIFMSVIHFLEGQAPV